MIGKVPGGTRKYLSYFGKNVRRYREVPGGTFPILVWISPVLILFGTICLGTIPFVYTVRFLIMEGSR